MVRAPAVPLANIGGSWQDHGTTIRMDVLSIMVALMLHAPLYWMKVDAHKKQTNLKTDRLVSVDLLDTLKKEEPPAVAAPPPPVEKKNNLMEKLKLLVHKEPPPPPPPPEKKPEPLPEKIADVPKPIALQPNLNVPPPVAPKLATKQGFQTTLDPKIVEQKQLALNQAAPVGIAPLSAKKLGTIEDRSALKNDKGNFKVASQSIGSIGGEGPSLAGAQAAPAIQIQTGGKGSVEKFSAPLPQKSDKGRIGAIPTGDLGGPQMGLRDSIIARDAAPTMIGGTNRGGVAGGVAGGVPGGVVGATKKDAGRFSDAGVPGGTGVAGGAVGAAPITAPISALPSKPREKKGMFTITGPLKDRKIVNQVMPEYPAWAQAQGIEAAVVLEFTVDSDGNVKPTIVVRRTSGYPKLDQVAIQALEKWKFVPLADGANRDEVGLITFNFALS